MGKSIGEQLALLGKPGFKGLVAPNAITATVIYMELLKQLISRGFRPSHQFIHYRTSSLLEDGKVMGLVVVDGGAVVLTPLSATDPALGNPWLFVAAKYDDR